MVLKLLSYPTKSEQDTKHFFLSDDTYMATRGKML